jgi:Family of unknown function (DUF5302)
MDEQQPREQQPVDDPAGSEQDGDDLRRKFQEALARKHAQAGGPHGQAAGGRGVGPSAGGKTQRQFRRKSG